VQPCRVLREIVCAGAAHALGIDVVAEEGDHDRGVHGKLGAPVFDVCA
jgi:hypothetical protein